MSASRHELPLHGVKICIAIIPDGNYYPDCIENIIVVFKISNSMSYLVLSLVIDILSA